MAGGSGRRNARLGSSFFGFGATVDWPGAHYWRKLSDHYPKEKIVLSARDAESWNRSIEKSILPILPSSEDLEFIGFKLIAEGVFGGKIDNRMHMSLAPDGTGNPPIFSGAR